MKKQNAVKQIKEVTLSLTDRMLNSKSKEEREVISNDFTKIFRSNGPCIYAFVTNKVKDAIKIGYTDQYYEKRIDQWRKHYGQKEGDVTCIGCWSSEEIDSLNNRVFFWDHAVHKNVENRGYANISKQEFVNYISDEGKKIIDLHYSSEFFKKYKSLLNGELDNDRGELSAELIEDIIIEMRRAIKDGSLDFKTYQFDEEGKTSSKKADIAWKTPDTYQNTSLQEEAIKNGVNAINKGKKKLLMAAVMRFGKTHACYEIINQCKDINRVIVTSAKADVRKAWRDDINHYHFADRFVFLEPKSKYDFNISYKPEDSDKVITKNASTKDLTELLENIEKNKKVLIVFATLQDLAGSLSLLKEKHKGIFDKEFDMMIVDETHYGSHAGKFGNITGLKNNDLDCEDYSDIEEEIKRMEENQKQIESLNIKYKAILQVSGTPYYILASNEMFDKVAEIISKVSYTDMIIARDKWERDNKDKDRSESPYFGVPTLHKIGLQLTNECQKIIANSGLDDSMSTLLQVKSGKFVHEKAIKNLMKGIFGDGSTDSIALLKNKKVDGNKVCKHTMIRLPGINKGKAMEDLLNDTINTKEREVIRLSGENPSVSDVDELNKKLTDLDNNGKCSIILTVNVYTTGVSMPLIDSMIYMRNTRNPQDYDQAIFRLCTRNFKKVKDPEEGMPKLINMKENVYLIDFNVSNIFRMMANSAKMQAITEGNPSPKRIKELIEQDISAMPLYCERGDEVMTKMCVITPKDMMEIYGNYNANKSITDIANDEIDLFDSLFRNETFKNIINSFNVEADNSKNSLLNAEGADSLDDLEEIEKKNNKSCGIKINKENRKLTKEEQDIKAKFKRILKCLLYCNLCLDIPYVDMDDLLEKAKKDDEFKSMLKSFKISIHGLEKMFNAMPNNFKQLFNNTLLKISLLAEDTNKGDHEKFMTAISDLGRIEKNEVITPSSIVKKMIAKLDKKDFENAKSILLVNEKQGEFFAELCKQFGKEEMVKKCKIVPSSEMTKFLIKKLLKTMNLSDYINNIILDIKDNNDDGKYDINDFLKINNNELLNMNSGKKFDVVLMNPPYGSVGGDTLHLKFVDKCLNIADYQVTVMPFAFVTKAKHKPSKKYKEKFSPYLSEVEEVNSNEFAGTAMHNVGIYVFGDETKDINIKYVNSQNETLTSLLDKSEFNDYEQCIINMLTGRGQLPILNIGRADKRKKELVGMTTDEIDAFLINKVKRNTLSIKTYLDNECTILLVNVANGGMNGRAISSKNGQIFTKYNEVEQFFINAKVSSGYNAIVFDSKKAAENCKIAIQNPLLRFTIYRLQDDQNMYARIYKCITDINWEDPRVKTDEGLLEVCGCPKDKCKEYADYCKKIIEKVDNKK